MIDRIDPVPDVGRPVVEPITRPRLLTPAEREQERRRREEQRRRRKGAPERPESPSEGPPRLDVRG